MTYSSIRVENQNGIGIITINRERSLNALNNEVFTELVEFFSSFDSSDAKGLIITGAGQKAFVAGADIKEFLSLDQSGAKALAQRGHDLLFTIENLEIPVVAAINGFALGGGLELAMACHLRIAGSHAKLGQPEVNLGILPGYGGTQRLTQLIGKGRSMEMILTADMISAQKALEYGLVNIVVEPGGEVEASKSLVNKISHKAPLAISKSIACINAFYTKGHQGFAEEVEAFAELATTQDFKEGSSAFIEKRKPTWSRT